MNVNPTAVQRFGRVLLLVLIVFELFLVVIYLTGVVLTGKAYPLFDMDGQMTISSVLQALQLLLIGIIALSLFIFGRHSHYPPSRFFSFTVAFLFTYASVDEVFKVHLQLHHLLDTPHNKDWMPLYLAIGISTLVVFHRDFIRIWYFHRKVIEFVALGMGIFILGGFGGEVFKSQLLQLGLTQTYHSSQFTIVLIEALRVAVEEFSELIGESFTLYGLCLFMAKRLEKKAESAIAKL